MMRNLVTMGLSAIETSVVKATYDDDLAPKEKHVVFLIECTAEYDLVALFDRRLAMPKWNVVFKALIVLHRLSIEGQPRFLKDLASNAHTFNLHSFFDTSLGSQDHQEFIGKYADYLAQKVYVYKLLGVCIERRPPTESKEWARKLDGFALVKSLPALSQQFDKILLCAPYGSADVLHAQIPVAALSYLVKDAFRIYSTLTVLMLGVVDHYLELDANQTKLILTVCQSFRSQNLRFKKWTQQLAELGFAHDKLFPDLVPIPDALFELLQDHINVKSGGRAPPASSAASSSSASSAQPSKRVSAAAVGKKSALAKKKSVAREEEEEDEDNDAMNSSEDDVAPVTRRTASLQVSKPKGKKAAPPPEEEEEVEEEVEEEEEDEDEVARKAAKKAKKAAKKAKKEREAAAAAASASKGKKKKHVVEEEEEAEEEVVEEEEEEQPKPKKNKKSKSKASVSGEVDLLSVMSGPAAGGSLLDDDEPPLMQSSHQPPQNQRVPSYLPPGASATPFAGAPMYGHSTQQYHPQPQGAYGGQPQYAAYANQPGPAYGAPVGYGQPAYGGNPLAQLQPLSSSSSSSSRPSGPRYQPPGEDDDNTTAVGGIYDQRPGSGGNAFADIGNVPKVGKR